MNNKFVEIIHNIMESRDDMYNTIEIEIDELIKGKIGINNIDIRRDYNISYTEEEEKLIDEITIEIDFFKKIFYGLRQRYSLYHLQCIKILSISRKDVNYYTINLKDSKIRK